MFWRWVWLPVAPDRTTAAPPATGKRLLGDAEEVLLVFFHVGDVARDVDISALVVRDQERPEDIANKTATFVELAFRESLRRLCTGSRAEESQ